MNSYQERFHHLKDELSEYDLEFCKEFQWGIYSYESLSYEGIGYMLFMKNNEFGLWDLGHCSCFGPTQDIESQNIDTYNTVELLLAHVHEEVIEKIKDILDYYNKHKQELPL